MIQIRPEHRDDIAAIRDLNRRAFGQEQEGRIVDVLRANGSAQLSLVAIDEGRVVGHIMYSPLQIGPVEGSALGPMAVDPEVQRQGMELSWLKRATLGCAGTAARSSSSSGTPSSIHDSASGRRDLSELRASGKCPTTSS